MRLIALILAALLTPGGGFAHGDISERIAEADARVAMAPRDAEALIRRGELHRLHGDPEAARRDFDRAREVAPDLPEADFALGRLELETGDAGAAVVLLDRYLAARPDGAEGFLTRARARAATGDAAGAVADFDRCIALTPAPTPELYLERAAALSGEAALEGLDAGIARIGPVVTLVGAAVQAAIDAGRPDLALERLALLPGAIRETPRWRGLRGDLLAMTGDGPGAAEAYEAALAAIAAQPEGRRNMPEALRLAAELEAKRALLVRE